MSAPRRGTGSIRRYKGTRFLATVCHAYKQHRRVCATRAEAQHWITATLTALQAQAQPVTSADMIAVSVAKTELPEGISLSEVVSFYLKHNKHTGETIAQVAEQFITDKSRAGLRPGSMRNLRWHIQRLTAHLGALPIRAATTQDIAAAIAALHGTTPSTGRNDTRRAWMNLWNWARRAGLTDSNPVEAITKSRTDELTPDCYTPAQVSALLKTAATGPRHHRAMLPVLAIGFFAGLRMGEIARLTWTDIDLDAGHIHVSGATSKIRARRYATINPTLRAWLLTIPRRTGQLIRVQDRARIMRLVSLRNAAGVPFIRNGIRHSFASYHLALHQDATRTAFELGHTRPDLLYRHYRNLVTRSAAEEYWNLTPQTVTYLPQELPQPPNQQSQHYAIQ